MLDMVNNTNGPVAFCQGSGMQPVPRYNSWGFAHSSPQAVLIKDRLLMTKVIIYPLRLLHDVALPCRIFNGLFATRKKRAVIPFLQR